MPQDAPAEYLLGISTLVRGMTANDDSDDGSFVMHVGGEVDIRGVYCALSVARLTGVYTDDMFRGTELWVARWVVQITQYM